MAAARRQPPRLPIRIFSSTSSPVRTAIAAAARRAASRPPAPNNPETSPAGPAARAALADFEVFCAEGCAAEREAEAGGPREAASGGSNCRPGNSDAMQPSKPHLTSERRARGCRDSGISANAPPLQGAKRQPPE